MRRTTKKRPRGGATVPCTCSKKGPTRVLDTRRVNTYVVRLRVCTECGRRFRTKERTVR